MESYATYGPESEGFLASADLNGDGMLDLLALNDGTLDIFFGQPDGGLGAPFTYPGGGPFGVGDLNGDGYPDVAMSFIEGGVVFPVQIYLNDGGGGLLPSGFVDAAQFVVGIGIGDLNDDGFADLVLAEGGFDGGLLLSSTAEVAFGNGLGGFTAPVALPGLGFPLVVADLNQDGLADIAANTSDGSQLAVLINQGDGGFRTTLYPTSALGEGNIALLPHAGGPPDLVLGDTGFDNAGIDFGGGIQVLENLGDGTFAIGPNLQAPGGTYLAIGDFNGDCIPDIATSGVGASVLYGDGDGGFAPAVKLQADGSAGTLAVLGPVENPRALAGETDGYIAAGIIVYGDASQP